MITVGVARDKTGEISGFTVSGHAGYSKHGQDIVCAAVTVLTFNAVNSIQTFTNQELEVEQGKSGYLKVAVVPSGISSEAVLLLNSMLLGLKHIRKQYRNYLEIIDEEV